MHKFLGTIAVGVLAVSTTACAVDTSPDGSPDENLGVAQQKSIETPTFPSSSSGMRWGWNSAGAGGVGADFVTMSNTLGQSWWVQGVGYWPSYEGLTASQANINACQANSIDFYSSYYCGAWYNWAGTNGEQTVNAVAEVSGGKITNCQARAQTGTLELYFSCATEWSTSTYTHGTSNVFTEAFAN
jgi:hypothetical protein